MNFVDENAGAQMLNVVSLFKSQEVLSPDPLSEMLKEGESENHEAYAAPEMRNERRKLVREDHFPEQGLFILDQQLEALSERLSRIKFYLTDLDDILPK
jgi:hypothetical protein